MRRRATLRDWMARACSRATPTPALYFYSQELRAARRLARTSATACSAASGSRSSRAASCARTSARFPGPKADRLALLRATGAYLSPIFGLYARPGERLRDVAGVARRAARRDAPATRGDVHRALAHRPIRRRSRASTAALAPETIFIADGHHRYETALAYRDERRRDRARARSSPTSPNMEEEGLVVLPTHRLLRVAAAPRAGGARGAAARVVRRRAARGRRAATGRRDRRRPARPPPPRCGRATRRAARARRPAAERARARRRACSTSAILEPLLGVEPGQLEFTHDDEEAIDAVAAGRARRRSS